MNLSSPCPKHDTGNHLYKKVKGGLNQDFVYRCCYCGDTRRKRPTVIAHIHNYQAYPKKDLLFCNLCGNTKSIL